MEKLTTDLEKEPDSIIIEETEAAEETGDPDEVELGFASAREENTDIKGKLHKVKAWFKKLAQAVVVEVCEGTCAVAGRGIFPGNSCDCGFCFSEISGWYGKVSGGIFSTV